MTVLLDDKETKIQDKTRFQNRQSVKGCHSTDKSYLGDVDNWKRVKFDEVCEYGMAKSSGVY